MGYLLLALSLFFGATKGFCGKKTSKYTTRMFDAVCANVLRMFLCIVIGFFTVAASSGLSALAIDGRIFAISLLSGVSTSVFVVSWLFAVQKGAYMMIDVFCMLGLTVPIIGSLFCFGETVRFTQWLGIAVLLVASLIMCSYNNSIKTKLTASSAALLLICGFSSGATDFSQKLFSKYSAGVSTSVFSFYTYLVSFAVLLVCIPFLKPKSSSILKEAPKSASALLKEAAWTLKPIFGFIVIMSACLFLNSYTKTLAAGYDYLPSAVLYPLSWGISLLLSTAMSALFFGERLTAKSVVGVLLAFVGVVVVNF